MWIIPCIYQLIDLPLAYHYVANTCRNNWYFVNLCTGAISRSSMLSLCPSEVCRWRKNTSCSVLAASDVGLFLQYCRYTLNPLLYHRDTSVTRILLNTITYNSRGLENIGLRLQHQPHCRLLTQAEMFCKRIIDNRHALQAQLTPCGKSRFQLCC